MVVYLPFPGVHVILPYCTGQVRREHSVHQDRRYPTKGGKTALKTQYGYADRFKKLLFKIQQ